MDGSVDSYSLRPPPVYYVLSGDLHVNYSRPSDVILPHAFVRLEYWSKTRNQAVEVQSLGLALDRRSGALIFACGVLEIAGSYSLRMFTHRGGTILARASLDVRWPEITVSLPSELIALTTSAKLEVTSSATCAAKREQFQFRVKLYHMRRTTFVGTKTEDDKKSPEKGGVGDPWRSADVVSEMRFPAIDKNNTAISLGCHLFDLDGWYRAVLVSTSPDAPPLSSSNVLSVVWGHGYQLSVFRPSVFPCNNTLSVVYSYPPCASADDRIRLYSRTRTAAGSPAAPLDRKYVIETRPELESSKMELKCDLFSVSASGFCLTYVSVTRGDVFTEQTEKCLPAYPNSAFPIAGNWGQWTSWGACSVTCGAGKKQRFRLCDSPPPRHGGEFCQGGHVEWSPCLRHCSDMLPRTPLHSPVLEPSCPCGCNKAGQNEGQIIATGRCQGLSKWTLQVDDGQEIVLHFDYFNLNYSQQWVKIRDGTLPNDKLLFSSFDSGYPVKVVTSGPVATVEFMTSPITSSSGPATYRDFPEKASLPIHINGFIVSYHSSAAPITTAGPLLFKYHEKPAMLPGVTIAGIAICVAAIAVAVAFVIVQRFTAKGRRAKYAMAASTSMDSPTQTEGIERGGEAESNNSPAHRTLSSAQSSSPSSQGNTINVDMEVPLTGKLKRKAGIEDGAGVEGRQDQDVKEKSSKELGKSRHQKKKRKKKLMVRIDMNPVALQSSEQGPTANAGTSSSPRLEVIDTDEIEKLEMISPTVPKSDHATISPPSKHHCPHHHRRRHRDRPEVSSSKFDLLRKLRHARGGLDAAEGDNKNELSRSSKSASGVPSDLERDVTGSSGSRSPVSVATTKAEVNWPKSTDGSRGGDSGGVGGAANFVRAALHEVVGRTFASSSSTSDRHKRSAAAGLGYNQHPQRRPPSEEIPLMDSMTSSLDSPSHFNTIVKSESQDSATTSFVNRGDGLPPARRPTSLTASYNSTVSNDGDSPSQELQLKSKHFNRSAVMDKVSGVPRPTKPSPSALTPSSSSIPPPPSASDIKSQSQSESTKRTLPQLRSYPHPSSSSKPPTKPHQIVPERAQSMTTPQTPTPTQPHFDERVSSLPKPDGQSPRPSKRESPGPSTPDSKTLTRTANPPRTNAGTSNLGAGKNSNLAPISINTSNSGSGSAAIIQGTISPETAGSSRNLAIPPHLQGKKAPGNHGDLAQAQNSSSRLSGKSTPTSQGLPSPDEKNLSVLFHYRIEI
ncbi:thrombospondin-1 [Elysia marginata]|uniref:Thrombospondin-1 n=1 Tax=Elysia marginata TaxID=1093978 RepID=A0AAV4HER1_9GAST|nr:thrombospondin-1 [Elysia marginata]